MPGNTDVVHTTLYPELLSLNEVWERVDPLASDLGAYPAEASLPYHDLGGPGFERLIYEVLQAEKQYPWFFGRNGDAQFGIDIVAKKGDLQVVYQCKNEGKEPPQFSQVSEAVKKFEVKWLGNKTLPAPKEFIYCSPHPLNAQPFVTQWTKYKEEFERRTGVSLSFVDKHELDTRLRRLPDLVAGLFSDSCAEHFCGKDDWRHDDPWIRVKRGPARVLGVERFLERHDNNAIHVADVHEKLFLEALDVGSTVALRGLPGSGKTFLGLELACQMRQPTRRIYYATWKSGVSVDRLWQSTLKRLSLPAVFVLDDCHLAPSGAMQTVLESLNPERSNNRLELVLILRGQASIVGNKFNDSPAWLARLNEAGADLNLQADTARTFDIASHLRPDFKGLSPARQRRLHHACGGDLLLLDEVLQHIAAPGEIETLELDGVLAKLRSTYFGANCWLPTLAKLAALAQFDLVPLSDFFDGQWKPGEETLAHPLTSQLFGPPRYQFIHSSLAELVLRALTQLEVGDETLDEAVVSKTAGTLCSYLQYLCARSELSEAGPSELIVAVQQCLKSRLNLTDNLNEARIKAVVLSDEKIKTAIKARLKEQSFASLSLYLFTLSFTEDRTKSFYVDLVQKRVFDLFQSINKQPVMTNMTVVESDGSIGTLNRAMHELGRADPDVFRRLEDSIGATPFLRLIVANGTLADLFGVLQNATPEFREALLEQLTSDEAVALVSRTISSGRSIGTLSLAMRELGEANSVLLGRLERSIGAVAFLRLIIANGTLFELFSILQNATPEFREALLEQLTSDEAMALVNRTISSGRSIGTLNLAMRELGKADSVLLGRLERSIGAAPFLRLIVANGTLFELFRILQYATFDFRETLSKMLTAEQAAVLVNRTIASGRSIGTLGIAMRELGGANSVLLDRLELSIGATDFLRLIVANGTLFELFSVLQYATPNFREALLEQLTSVKTKALVNQTIASGRSVGTLGIAMRDLGGSDSVLLDRLERTIGAAAFLHLLVTNGTLVELFKVMENSTQVFRTALLEQLTAEQAAALLKRTIVNSRRIESFHFMLGMIASSSDQLYKLEELLGVGGWWRLFIATGSLNSLSNITRKMHDTFCAQVTAAATNLTVEEWEKIITRGLFLNACDFIVNDLLSYPDAARQTFRTALANTAGSLAEQACWFDLNPSRPPTESGYAEGAILRAALSARMEKLQLPELFDLDFREAVNALAMCWRERSDLRSDLGKHLRKILPPRSIWPRKKGEIAALRFVLMLARNPEFSNEDAQWLLAETVDFLDREVCTGIHTLPLFLLAWNIAALSYERGSERDFARAFSDTTQEILLDALAARVRPKGTNAEKLMQYAFGGLLAFLFPKYKQRLIELLAPLKNSIRWLNVLALEQGFLPAVYALEGFALHVAPLRVFTPGICDELLKKFEEYEVVGPALDHLRLRVRDDSKKFREH